MLQACTNNQSANTDSGTDTSSSEITQAVSDPSDTVSTDLNEFTLKAASGGMMEVQLGQIAKQNAKSSRVKNFGAMMINDHTTANNELKALATQKNITIPTSLDPDHQKHIDDLRKRTGDDFDQHYIDMMEKDHKEDIDLFEKASQDSKDPEIKAFAAKTLPVLRVHLDSVQAIRKSIKK